MNDDDDIFDAATEAIPDDFSPTTLAESKYWLRVRLKQGAPCPCCNRFAKIYRRALGAQMALWLIWLVRVWQTTRPRRDDAWVDVKHSPVRGGDYAKLLHWDLVEHKAHEPGDDKPGNTDTRDSGMWRPTERGIDFVHMRLQVRRYVYLYNNISLTPWEVPKLITIRDALGKKHSYTELMSAPIPADVVL